MKKLFSIESELYNIIIRFFGLKLTIKNPKKKGIIFYNNTFEKKFVAKFFKGFNTQKYINEIERLKKNLDQNSTKTVDTICKRIEVVLDKELPIEGFFDKAHSAKITELRFDFEQISEPENEVVVYNKYILPIKHFEPSVFYFKHGIDLINHLERINDKEIIDAGGFIGDSALILSPLTAKNVHSFEAVNKNYKLMLKTIQLNGLKNIVPVKLALGSTETALKIKVAASCSSINDILDSEEEIEEETINCTTIDKYVEENKLNIGLIKVDIEGFEQELLKGAEKTIKTQKPTLLISIYHNTNDFLNIKPIIESWDLGYRFKIYKPCEESVILETLLIAELP